MNVFSFVNATSNPSPRVPFARAARLVLGARYDLSVAVVTPQKMKSINRTYRRKNSSTDILAFALSESAGEIFLSLPDVHKKAKAFRMTPASYLKYLFVHGLVHLKGFDHGTRMTALEKRYCKKLGFRAPEV